ncbi:hypothetical protein ACS8E9_09545 [Pseudomonas neustonica]
MSYAKTHGTWADVVLEKRAVRKNMKYRRALTWLNKAAEHELVLPLATE